MIAMQCMVDIDGTGQLTLDEALLVFDECGSIANDVYTGESQELEEVIQKLGVHILENRISVFTAVAKHCGNEGGNGKNVTVLNLVWSHT